jgi:hypothetical protein
MSRPKARIVAETRNGKTEISVYEPDSMRHHRTGLEVPSGDKTATTIQKLKDQLERAGNDVSVKEM